jgi:hypothetical protein
LDIEIPNTQYQYPLTNSLPPTSVFFTDVKSGIVLLWASCVGEEHQAGRLIRINWNNNLPNVPPTSVFFTDVKIWYRFTVSFVRW